QAGVGWSTQIYQCVIHHCGIGQVDVIATGEHRGLTRITVTAAAPVFRRDIDPQTGLELENIRCRSGVGAFVFKAAVTTATIWWRVRWSGRGTTAGTATARQGQQRGEQQREHKQPRAARTARVEVGLAGCIHGSYLMFFYLFPAPSAPALPKQRLRIRGPCSSPLCRQTLA